MEEMAIFQELPNDYERSLKKVWDWKHEKEGLTYKELAERIHMDDQTISRLINNKRDPSINSLVLICLGTVSYTHLDVYKRQVVTILHE